jgi:hypothetical protein
MDVKISDAISMIVLGIKAKLVPMMKGSPAIGKSGIVHQVAKDFNLMVIDLRLSQCDPTDLMGFPRVTGNRAGYAPMETFPIEGDTLPINPETKQPYAGWLLFLDEFTSASKAVQAAAYKIVLDRMVGIHHLHKNVAIVCAGNLESDNAIVEPMSTALQSRLMHMQLVIDYKEWLNWASANEIDFRITSYINFKPGVLYTFKPDHTDDTYASPRTWEFVSRVLKIASIDDKIITPILAGLISEGVAREFLTYCKIFQDLPTIPAIIDAPEAIRIPQEPSILFALTGAIGHNADETNVAQLMKFVGRMPIEFQVVCLREMVRRNKKLVNSPAVQKWVTTSAATLF